MAIRHISALSDALLGQRRWDDPQVIIERNWLLRADADPSWIFIERCRERLAKAFRRNMRLVRLLEREYYGENSFYYLREIDQYQEPACEEGDNLMEGLEELEDVEIEG